MPTATIDAIRAVGDDTVAIELRTPSGFTAKPGQFILVRAEISGEEETGYYTLSSPEVGDTFEITVDVDPDEGTLGPWLKDHEEGTSIRFDGPFGDVTYDGHDDVVVLAKGPGLGPAVGIAERAIAENRAATILYEGDDPPHRDRLEGLQADGATVAAADTTDRMSSRLADLEGTRSFYVFGFDDFVNGAKTALEDAGVDADDVAIENFGPA